MTRFHKKGSQPAGLDEALDFRTSALHLGRKKQQRGSERGLSRSTGDQEHYREKPTKGVLAELGLHLMPISTHNPSPDHRKNLPASDSSAFPAAPPPPPAASPRPRPGEASGVSPEIKALQQTRRLLANARERTRVHTISAAFEALRKQVPCYSYGQKLSKLAILRIACNYILSLARLADLDYSADHSNMSFSECVEQCTRTLQAEGRSKKRKE
ncbi:protein atonal homolog 8 [Corapipo altera]|uniref:protein atonal homolog 8 n=1 Tax=Corapipo altera TaxID=415028 RepID=UPI000FD6A03C|nr:protein atonal homolog 8 [Corapipo altera]